MTDHFPDATKKVLSPAAQAVLDAFDEGWTYYDDIGPANIAAALRAAIDHALTAQQVLDIANELDRLQLNKD